MKSGFSKHKIMHYFVTQVVMAKLRKRTNQSWPIKNSCKDLPVIRWNRGEIGARKFVVVLVSLMKCPGALPLFCVTFLCRNVDLKSTESLLLTTLKLPQIGDPACFAWRNVHWQKSEQNRYKSTQNLFSLKLPKISSFPRKLQNYLKSLLLVMNLSTMALQSVEIVHLV